MDKIGLSLTNNGLERIHRDPKETYTQKVKLKLNDFLFLSIKFIRDFSKDQSDEFKTNIDIQIVSGRKQKFLLRNKKEGPFMIYDQIVQFSLKRKKT